MRPLILITNDDGINSPGLLAMAESAERVGDVVIVAPACQQTSMGRAFPRTNDLGVIDEHELYLNGRKIKGIRSAWVTGICCDSWHIGNCRKKTGFMLKWH